MNLTAPRTARLAVSTAVALCASLLTVSVAQAQTRDIEAGPLWNNLHAMRACPSVCARVGAQWQGAWRTTVAGRMSVCGCVTPTPTPCRTPLPPGRYVAAHPHWSGYVTINADGTYARDNGDPGTWTFDGRTLALRWRNWGTELLQRQADGSFRGVDSGFTLRFDGPIVAEAPQPAPDGELMVNGGFELPSLAQGSYQQPSEIVGWRRSFGDGIEVQNHVAGSPAEGAQHVELAAEAPTGIYQDVAVRAGARYDLAFSYSPRPGVGGPEGNTVDVLVNGERVTTLAASGEGLADTRWMRVVIPVRATSSSLRVEFRDASAPDTVGGYIDGVSLRAAR